MAQQQQNEASLLLPSTLDHYWPFIERDMDACPEAWESWYTKETLREEAMIGALQVWAAGSGDRFRFVVFTRVCVFLTGNRLQILFAMGMNIDELLPLIEGVLERFCHMTGCVVAEVYGRAGWERKLAPLGFKKTSIILTRPVVKQGVH